MRQIFAKVLALVGLCGVFVVSWNCDEILAIPDYYSFQPDRLSLDTARVGDRVASGTVVINNILEGAEGPTSELRFTGLRGDCPAEISWEPTEATIAMGRSLELTALFVPQRAYSSTTCLLFPSFNGTATGEGPILEVTYAATEATCGLQPGAEYDYGAIELGTDDVMTLTVYNETAEDYAANQFRFLLDNPSDHCDLFTIDAADTVGVLGPAESQDISVRFAPDALGTFECTRSLSSLREPADAEHPNITNTCPAQVLWRGTAVSGPACALQPGAELEYGDVEVGSSSDLVLTVRNAISDVFPTNQFKFLFDNPSGDCRLFTIDPADTVGVLGAGESRDITVHFDPDAAGSFECTRSLSSLKEPADPADPSIADACPAEVVMRGTGVAGALAWRDCSQVGVSEDLYGIYGVSEDEIYTVGDAFTVRASLGACSWIDVPGPAEFDNIDLTDVWATSEETWVVGNISPVPGGSGAILRSDISGWTKVDEGWLVTYGAVWGSASNDVYFVGTGVSTDFPNAKHWNGSAIDTLAIDYGMSELTGISGTAGNDVWAVLKQSFVSNRVYRFQGSQWENQTLPFTPNPLHDVWAIQGTGFYAVYAVGEDGAIYHYNGSSWTDESIAGETNDFYGVWVSQSGLAWVVGQNGAIYHKSGSNWTLQNPPAGLERDLRDVWGSSDENVFAVGADGLILRYAR